MKKRNTCVTLALVCLISPIIAAAAAATIVLLPIMTLILLFPYYLSLCRQERTRKGSWLSQKRAKMDRLPRPFLALFWGQIINGAGTFVSSYLVVTLMQRGIGAAMATQLLGVIGAGAPGASLVGWISDRFGRRRTLMCSLTGYALMTLILGFANSSPILFIAAICEGLFSVVNVTTLEATTADLFPTVSAFKDGQVLLTWSFNLGRLLSSLIAIISLWLTNRYQVLFGLDTLTTLALGILVFRGVPKNLSRANENIVEIEKKPGGKGKLIQFVIFLFLAFLAYLLYFQYNSTLPILFAEDNEYLILITIYSVVCVAFGGIKWRIEPYKGMALSALLLGAGFGLPAILGNSSSPLATTLWAVGIVMEAFGYLLFTAAGAMIARGYSEESGAHGLFLGLAKFPLSLARVMMPLLAVISLSGGTTLWGALCLGVSFVAAIGFSLLGLNSKS